MLPHLHNKSLPLLLKLPSPHTHLHLGLKRSGQYLAEPDELLRVSAEHVDPADKSPRNFIKAVTKARPSPTQQPEENSGSSPII